MPINWDDQKEKEMLIAVIVETVINVSGAIWGKVTEEMGDEGTAEAVRIYFENMKRAAAPTADDANPSEAPISTKSKTKAPSTSKSKGKATKANKATKDNGATSTASKKRKASSMIDDDEEELDNLKKSIKLDLKGDEATDDNVSSAENVKDD